MLDFIHSAKNHLSQASFKFKESFKFKDSFNILVAMLIGLACLAPQAQAAEIPNDPFESVMWKLMVERYFPDGEVVFDSRVVVSAPKSAENQFNVPVTVDATALENVEEIVAVADLNPIPHILTVRPIEALSFVGFRVKLQQGTPIHVGVRTADGVWHIGGAYVDAMGGGCTAPAMVHGTDNWIKELGTTRVSMRRESPLSARMTIRMRHPMDTGLAAGIPAFFMNKITVRNDAGDAIAELDLYEPVSENPTITIKPKVDAGEQTLKVSARDTEGNEFGFPLRVPSVIAQ